MLCPITLMWFADKSWIVPNLSHPPITPPALVPPQNSSTLEALLSQLHTDSWDSQNLVLCSNLGITNTTLNIPILSLVPVPVPDPILVPVPVPCPNIAFLCYPCCTHHLAVFWPVLQYFLFLMAMLSNVKNRFSDPTKEKKGRDQPRKDVVNIHQVKALREGCCERKEA